MKKKVLVAMSGGVDSSVTAFLLKKRGYEVAAITMCFGVKKIEKSKPACCGAEAIEDAKKVCRKLDIAHYVMDFSKSLEKEVISKFVSEYLEGRTPNPCVDCNKTLKFDILLKKALSLGFDFLATGHYARIGRKGKDFILKRAKDKTKDQSYFLYAIKKEALETILFPAGDFTKSEIRGIARKNNLPVADKPGSQDICFIPGKNYHDFIEERIGSVRRGEILDLEGNILGDHKGAFFYTVGQRGGLGISHKQPLYVLSVDTKKNRLIVGEKKTLKAKGLIAEEVNVLVKKLSGKAFARIRYNQKEAECAIKACGKNLKIIFEKKQEAITPGQSVVLYKGDTVLGGGVIEKVVNEIETHDTSARRARW